MLKHVAFLIVLFGCAIGASAAPNVRVEFVKPENLDVHMAGRPAFEAPGVNSDLRIRNRTTPPKISLQYVVKDRFGKVVAKGADLLIDLNYQWNVTYQGTDELYSEKALLRNWILSLSRKINRS
jgi:hypothetical protein